MNRRIFLKKSSLATASLAALPSALANHHKQQTANRPSVEIGGFTKPFAHLGPEESAEMVERIGWDGVELPVRDRSTHVELDRVEEDLPKMHDALGKRGKKIHLITTSINSVTPENERVLRVAANLGIEKYRLSYFRYDLSAEAKHPMEQLAALKPQLKELAALNREFGIKGVYQNHSASRYVGAPIWDSYELFHDIDPEYLGLCFDIGHATIEGGFAWENHFRVSRPIMLLAYVKDFVWERTDEGWDRKWVHLGDGMVNPKYFDMLFESGYNGPIIQHHEYDHGQGDVLVKHCQKDLVALRAMIGK
ncbi:sugar phosphate isomerase/epimerase [Opitutaceae bacterium]|nr:sugar phosphate isomerase/epimerase [Opitutaceae bacterium]